MSKQKLFMYIYFAEMFECILKECIFILVLMFGI